MAMEITKLLLKQYQRAAANLNIVAAEMEELEKATPEQIAASRHRALIYETIANELYTALMMDGVEIDNGPV